MAHSLAQMIAEQRRRIVLETLLASPANAANDAVLRLVVEARLDVCDRALIRADMEYLAAHGLVSIDKMAHDGQEIWRARLTDAGGAVARGRAHQGVAAAELS